MKQITREWLAFLWEQYPVGSSIRLNSMEDPYAPVEPGTMGTLQRIDDAGQFLMKWDNGRTLSLIPGEDSFSLILPEPTMMKLYMPLHADLYTKDDWSDTSEEPEMLTGRALMEYEDSILIALIKNRMSEEAERGIMRWYGREDSVDRKVKSVVFTAEEREGQLWGVAECKVVGELTPEELDTLKDYISGQASDGWVKALNSGRFRWMTENCMSISGISVTGVFRLKKSASPQNSPRVFPICASLL